MEEGAVGVSGAQLGSPVWPLGLHHEGVNAWFLCLVTHHTHTHNRTACCGVRSVGSVLQSVLQM